MHNVFLKRNFKQTLLLVLQKRAARLFKENGTLNQTAAAKYLKIPQPTIRRWLMDAQPDNSYIDQISEKFNITPAQMRGEDSIIGIDTDAKINEIQPDYVINITKRVPLLSEIQAGTWMETAQKEQINHADEWVITTSKVSDQSFALRVTGDSMHNPNGSPSIPEGSIVIIDPEAEPTNGKIVVARLAGTNEAILKKLVIDGPNRYLKPLNPDYKTIQITEGCIIIGVAKQILQDL